MRIPWDNSLLQNAETGISLAIPEISAEASLLIQTYTVLHQVIPYRDIQGYLITRILSLHIPKQLFYPDLYQGCGSATRFRDCCTKKKIKKNLLSPSHVAARRSRRYKTRRNTEFVFGQLHEM